MRLAGKVAVVTGASRGMGAEIALTLAREGANLVLAARTVESHEQAQETRPGTINDVAAKIRAMGGEVIAVRTDVSDKADVEALIEKAIDQFGRIDILVNSAWYVQFNETPLCDLIDEAMTEATLGVFKGILDCTRAVLPHMRRQGSGSIINITSTGAKNKVPLSPVYGGLKAATAHFSVSVAAAVGSEGIRVNCVAPGIIETASSHDCLPTLIATLRDTRIPMKRLGAESDVAQAVLFLADDATSSYVTGTTITVDGGFSQF